MKLGVISTWVLVLSCLFTFGASRTVTTTTLDNMWWPVIPGSLQYEIYNANSGDTILFDYSLIGTSPVFNVDDRFFNTETGPSVAASYVVIDALRGKPVGASKPKITVTGTPGTGGAFYLARNNTSVIGLEFENVDGNGILITGENITIDSCIVHGSTNAGINLTATSSNVVIKNSIVYDNNRTIGDNAEHAGIYALGSGNVLVDSCYIYDNNGNGVFFDNGSHNSVLSNSVIGRDILGNELGNGWNGLFARGSDNITMNLNIVVNNGKVPPTSGTDLTSLVSGVRFQSLNTGNIMDNYFGTDPLKTSAGNAFEGITLNTDVSNVSILRNVICNNGYDFALAGTGGGIGLRRNSGGVVVSNCEIKSNFIGVHADLTAGANYDYGISLEWGTNNTEIGGTTALEGNVIANTSRSAAVGKGCGVWIVSSGTTNNVLQNNVIRDNEGAGVLISGGGSGAASGNVIGTFGNGNIFSGNQYGVRVQDSGVNDNTIRYNSFSCNSIKGISLSGGGNDNYGNAAVGALPKSVVVNSTEGRPNYISGGAPSANALVDIYASDVTCAADCDSDANQGLTYITTVTANSTATGGVFLWEYDFVAGGSLVTPSNVVVLATEVGGAGNANTSEFSVCADFCNIPENALLSAADTDLCEGESVTLTATADGLAADEGYAYNWYLNSISDGAKIAYEIDDNSLSVNQAGTYYVLISSQMDSAACSDTTTPLAITVNELPTVSLPVSDFDICTGDTAELVIVASIGSGNALNYTWSPNVTTDSTYLATSAGSYSITVSDAVTGCSASDRFDVTENSLPVISISAPFFCQEDSTLVDAGIEGMNYLWVPGGSAAQSFYTTVEDSFYVTVTDPITNCSAIDSVFADQSPDPKPVITIAEFDTICKLRGDEVEVTSEVVSNTSGTYSWSTGEISSSIVVSDTILYVVTFSDSFACTGRDTITIINECIAPDPKVPNIVTENNPWTPIGEITPDQLLESDLVIYNRWGIKMFSTEEMLPFWRGEKNDGTACASGVYYFVWKFRDVANKSETFNGFIQLVKN